MKKCYKAPEMVVVDLELESICVVISGDNDNIPDMGAAETRDSYRSTLWND